jgi:hypothetical protein
MLVVAGPVGVSEHDPGSHPERPARALAPMAGVDDLDPAYGDALA